MFSDPNRDLKLLPIAAVYGANGSGKSNFYYAIEFIRNLVLRPAQAPEEQILVTPFRLDDTSEEQPSRFSVEILTDGGAIFRLSFSVTAKAVTEEKLELIDGGKDRLVYSRATEDGKPVWDLKYFERDGTRSEDRDFMSFKARDTLANQLFISVLRGRQIAEVESVIAWFRDGLQLMTPNTVFKQLEMNLKAVDGLRAYCIEALRNADTGICDLDREEISLDAVPLPAEIKDMKQFLRKMIPEGSAILLGAPDGQRFTLRHENDELRATRLLTVHRTKSGKNVKFYMADESDGTQRFVDLLPVFYDLAKSERPKVFVIDEIDRSLHPELTRNLLEAFLESLVPSSRSQLIFTTHDVMLLDQDLLRRDEIWFFDKEEDGHSRLSALSDFKGVRADKDIRKSYLLGRFGGTPRIMGFPRRAPSTEDLEPAQS